MWHEICGPILVVLTSLSLLPQIVKVVRTKSAKDLSLVWLWYAVSLHLFWTIFNSTREYAVIYLYNSTMLGILTVVLLVVTYKYRKGT